MAARFYTSDELSIGEYVVRGDEANHLASVMRIQPDEVITLFNGDGAEYQASVVSVAKKSVAVNITAKHEVSREVGWPIVVASALPKGDRFDYLLEKLTETGCTSFIPLTTARSVVVPKLDKLAKWQRAVVEASKQCGRNRLMSIEPPLSFDQLLAKADLPSTKMILHPTSSHQSRSTRSGVVLATGPEGGFTDDEVTKAVSAGWATLSLGRSILRIETAAVAGVVWSSRESAPLTP
jgi:16S rRNA (uracil1498-N3)-methyltransferase